MIKVILVGTALLTLGACASQVPDSGVGFSDYAQYELDRAASESGQGSTGSFTAAPSVGATPLGQTTNASGQLAGGQIPAGDLAAAGIGSSTTTGAQTNGTFVYQPQVAAPGVIEASPGNAAPDLVNNTGISDEQDFSAVSGRESIESDAQRRQQQALNYEVVQPGAVPTRHGDSGPNIIEYALSAPNVKGQEWYSRSRLSGQGRYDRNCAKYPSPDEAQRDFLARGGPDRDSRGIDPDGDGFACTWDPAPFLLARASGQGN